MNISTRKIALAGSVGAVALVAVGSLALGVPEAITKASGSFFNNPTIKWGALISALIGTTLGILYLLANKDALKRKVTEYGEVSFVVRNGNPRRYRRGKRRGQLVLKTAGQGKNVIPKLRDQVTISWLLEVVVTEHVESMYKGRRLGYQLSIEYRLPGPVDSESLEVLRAVAFDFRDRNRYNEEEGTFEKHLKNRSIEAVANLLPRCEANSEGLPVIFPDHEDWLALVTLDNGVKLDSLRISLLGVRFTSQVELK